MEVLYQGDAKFPEASLAREVATTRTHNLTWAEKQIQSEKLSSAFHAQSLEVFPTRDVYPNISAIETLIYSIDTCNL